MHLCSLLFVYHVTFIAVKHIKKQNFSAVLNYLSCYICFCLFPFVFVSYWLYYLCIACLHENEI